MIDWPQVRAQFPILQQQVNGKPLIYFDSAATSQKPLAVIEAMDHYYRWDNANVHRGLHELSSRATDAFEAARAKIARFVGAGTADEIIYTRGTTEAINLVAGIWGAHFLKPGDVVLITEMEHHSNIVPWQLAAQRSGATLKFVPVLDDGTLDLVAADELLTAEVKLFAFNHISNSLGTINPVVDLCRKARSIGAVTLVDGAQAVGHVPVNVQDIGCDFYAFSGHKMWSDGYWRSLLSHSVAGKNAALARGGEMILHVSMERSTYKSGPARFEPGTPPIAGAIGMGAAVDYLESIGIENIAAYDDELTQYAMGRLQELEGIRILGPLTGKRGSLAAFTLAAAHPHDLVTLTNEQGLALRGGHHCTQPLMRRFKAPGTARASFYFYNTRAEIDAMMDILNDAIRFFSMNDELRDLYQQVILDHSRKPRNHGRLEGECVHVHGDNPSCGDEIDLYVKFDAEGKIEDLKFDGQGCAISQASASMMTSKIKGKSAADAATMREDFRRIVMGDGAPQDEDALGELQLLEGVQKFPQRVKCAMLAWRALEQATAENAAKQG